MSLLDVLQTQRRLAHPECEPPPIPYPTEENIDGYMVIPEMPTVHDLSKRFKLYGLLPTVQRLDTVQFEVRGTLQTVTLHECPWCHMEFGVDIHHTGVAYCPCCGSALNLQ